MNGAVIQSSEIVAAHDGVAELVITLKFENGGESLVTLDEYAARWLLEHSNCETAEALQGQSWELVRDALAASSSRYMNA